MASDWNGYGGRRPNSDKRGARRSYGDRRSDGERSYERKPYGDRRQDGERSYERKPYGDRRSDGERSYERKPYGDRRKDGERSYERKPYGDRRQDGERSYERKPYGDRRSDGERSYERKPYGDRRKDGERSYERKPYGDRRQDGERSYERKPYGDRRSDGDRNYERKPYGDRRKDSQFRSEREDSMSRAQAELAAVSEESAGIELPNIIMGRNPVKEAIKSGRSIDRILVIKEHDGSLGEIITLARDANLVIREVDRAKLDELCMPFGHNGKSGNHQGIVAEIPGVEYAELEDILEYAELRGEKPFVILLDGIEDPHNLGSIIRSAECAGAHGIVITKRRSASVTAAVVKTSAGAAEHMRIARVANLSNTISLLKEKNIWIAGADMEGKPAYEVDMKGGFALVIGGEGNGLSKLVKEQCDFLVSIPLKGHIDSLNAAVAGAIIMFEKNRQELNG